MIANEAHLYFEIEKNDKKFRATLTVKDASDDIIYQSICKTTTDAFQNDPVFKFLQYITVDFPDSASNKTNCRCNRCGNFSDFLNPIKKARIGFFGKCIKFVSKFFKISK